jgi:hypothetical protein
MNELKIMLRDGQTAFVPGETLVGGAGWNFVDAPRRIEARLFWRTRGKGTEDVEVVSTVAFEAPMASEARPFEFKLPNGPYSFSGRLISVIWGIELLAPPFSETARVEFVMAPDGREIILRSPDHAGEG